jgi:hypothetical protein
MSRKLFAFLLTELKTVRLVCQKCGGASELSVEQVAACSHFQCPACRAELVHPGILRELAKNIEFLSKLPGFDLEFVLPDPDAK